MRWVIKDQKTSNKSGSKEVRGTKKPPEPGSRRGTPFLRRVNLPTRPGMVPATRPAHRKNDIDRGGCRNGSLERLWCLLGRVFLEFAVILASCGLFFAALGLYIARFFNIFAGTRKL